MLSAYGGQLLEPVRASIARAILAEREQCAKIADREVDNCRMSRVGRGLSREPLEPLIREAQARAIAAAIRGGDAP